MKAAPFNKGNGAEHFDAGGDASSCSRLSVIMLRIALRAITFTPYSSDVAAGCC
jgi:hypothetical protein